MAKAYIRLNVIKRENIFILEPVLGRLHRAFERLQRQAEINLKGGFTTL